MWSKILLILWVLAPLVHLDTSSDVIECLVANEMFTRTEKQYIDTHQHTIEEPFVSGIQTKDLQKKVYSIEKRQRPFECISNRTDKFSTVQMKQNPVYQAVVLSCRNQKLHPICHPAYKYRSLDGTCNNLMNPKWGSQFSCHQRFLPQRYEGVSGFRQSVCGGPLPEPRTLSLKAFEHQNRPTNDITHMAMFFGQQLTHDITDQPITSVGTEDLACCPEPGKKQHPNCAPIMISRSDPFYSMFNITCFNVVRAAMCDTCDIGKRNQLNQVSSYIDLSLLYGPNDAISQTLRSNDGKGKLISELKNGEELMPPDYNLEAAGGCKSKTAQDYVHCFYSGDRRTNVHTPAMSLQTIFLREHNRIAEQLHKLNPYWDEETLFQESRKINIAQMQHIVYREFLPLIIGPDLMKLYGLDVTGESVYDPSVDATNLAEFNVAAFRIHSGINGIVAEYGYTGDKRYLRNEFQDAEPLYEGTMSSLVRGLCGSPAQKYDKNFDTDMTNMLYRQPKGYYGFDIIALHVNRGRDAGVPTYIEMVNVLSDGNITIQTFEELNYFMDDVNIEVLKSIYCDVRDIDLWVGMNNERVSDKMFVGPTAGKLIALSFNRLKRGDRFFYGHHGNFNNQQLNSLLQVSLAGILCDNTKILSTQRDTMRAPKSSNPILNCNNIPKVNLSYWAENRFWPLG